MTMRRKIKKLGRATLVFPMTLKGYSISQASAWWSRSYRDFRTNNESSLTEKMWAHHHGFLGSYTKEVEINSRNYKHHVSEKQYRYIQPINEKYNKWLNDKISVMRVYKPFSHLFPTVHFHFYLRDGKWKIIADSPHAKTYGDNEEAVMELLKDRGTVTLIPSTSDRPVKISYRDNRYFINDEETTKPLLTQFVFRTRPGGRYRRSTIMITDPIQSARDFVDEKNGKEYLVKLYILNSEGDNPEISDAFLVERQLRRRFTAYHDQLKQEETELLQGEIEETAATALEEANEDLTVPKFEWHRIDEKTGENTLIQIPCYEDIKQEIKNLCLYTPQLEFFALNLMIIEDGFKIDEMQAIPPYPESHTFSKHVNDYLLDKVREKERIFSHPSKIISHSWKRVTLQVRKHFARAFFPPTLFPYLSIRTIQEFTNDFFTNKDATFKEKLWAYKHGFQSYRLAQYGITKDNHQQYISDFEYKWLRHINNKYRTWFEDKVTIKYVLSDFRECFPGYYYFTAVKNGNSKIIPLMDCPKGYEATYDDIFRLVREKGILALKPDEGSHGEGFFKFTYENGNYYLNGENATVERVMELFTDVNNQYLITEYIQMHPEIAKIYSGSVNTVRLTVFKKDGITPYIGNGYMRFGTSETGGVDNIGAGGIGVDVNVETGYFYNPVKLKDGAILIPCPHHPDTGEKIEGYLPNWAYVRETILNIAASVPEVEYFGFDLAITADGIKFPEINRFPDYPRINKLSPATMEYLLYKLEQKRERFGYNSENPPKRLINLPKR